ncbi:uncharacterized protein LOC131160822 [Malania oleifera]|uniref:uncharacterized protein LOC131160822 n=1 Tax=Malania oleifera TaxID=397392 RepID=UPI0025AE0C9D|nr:uncharacterized protein LOC131160822 [Malania oleifera]
MVQGERETLKKFMHRFNAAILEVRNLDMKVALAALTTALQPESFLYSLGKNPPIDIGELMARAQKYINLEEMMDTKGSRIELNRKGNNREMGESSRSAKRQEATTLLTSPKMRGHDTKECIQLRNKIEALIKRGYLSRFIKKEDPQREPRDQRRPNANKKEDQVIGEIAVIFRGSASGGDSGGAHKSGDEEGVQQPHNDALVLSLLVANYKVRRVLIDNESSENIMFWSVLEGMKIGKKQLKPISTPLVGFGGDVVHPVGTITLPVTIRTTPQQVTSLIEFLVVDRPSVYNIILGCPLLNAVLAVTLTYHLKMKFPTPLGTGVVKGDQAVARNYYVIALKGKMEARETLTMEYLEVRGQYPQINTVDEDIAHVPLNGHQERSVHIRSRLPDTLRVELSKLLNEFANVFTWSAEDMQGIDPAIIEQRL